MTQIKSIAAVLWLSLFLGASWLPAGTGAQPQVALRLVPEKATFLAGAPIVVRLVATNLTDQPCLFLRPRPGTDSDGLLLRLMGKRTYWWSLVSAREYHNRSSRWDRTPAHVLEDLRARLVRLEPGKDTVLAVWDLSEMLPGLTSWEGFTPAPFHEPGKQLLVFRLALEAERAESWNYPVVRTPTPAERQELVAFWAQLVPIPPRAAGRHYMEQWQPSETSPFTSPVVAIEILGRDGPSGTVPFTTEALRKQAKLYAAATVPAIESQGHVPRRAPAVKAELVPALLALAQDRRDACPPDWDYRVDALKALGAWGPHAAAAVPTLSRLAEEGVDEEVQAHAVVALSKIADLGAYMHSPAASPSPALGQRERDAVVQVLRRILEGKGHPLVQASVLTMLAKTERGRLALKEAWLPLLDADDPAVRLGALELYGACFPLDEKATTVMVGLLKEPACWVRARALDEVYWLQPLVPDKRHIRVRMEISLAKEHPDPAVQKAAEEKLPFLMRITDGIVTAYLEDAPDPAEPHIAGRGRAWRTNREALRYGVVWQVRALAEAVPRAALPLRRLVNVADQEVRLAAIETLADQGPAVIEAVPDLEKAMREGPEDIVRWEAGRALAFIAPANPAPYHALMEACADYTPREFKTPGSSTSHLPPRRYAPALATLRPVTADAVTMLHSCLENVTDADTVCRTIQAVGTEGCWFLPELQLAWSREQQRPTYASASQNILKTLLSIDPFSREADEILATTEDKYVREMIQRARGLDK